MPHHIHRKQRLITTVLPLATGLLLATGMGLPAIAQTTSERAGYDYLERGWVDDAIQSFEQAVRQQPESVTAQLGLAIAYQRAGQDVNAWQAYQRVLSLDGQNRRALTAVGTLGGYRPEWQAAGIEALTSLLALEPQNAAARSQRALLQGYQGQFVAAIADYEILLANNPSPQTLVEAAQIYTYSGNYAQGLALFERHQQTGQSLNTAAAIAYAQTLQETGQPEAAIAVLDPRLQAETDNIDLRAALAAAYAANQQFAQAQDLLTPLRNDPNATLTLARALSRIGRQAGDREIYQDAIALYRETLAATPNPSYGLQVEAADVLSEDPASQAEALALYDDLLVQTPGEPGLVTQRLIVANALGELPDSDLIQELLALLQPLPSDATTRQQIGQALIRLDTPDPALLPIYADLIAAGTAVDFLYFRLAQAQVARENWTAAREVIAAYQTTPNGRNDLAAELLLADIDRLQGNFEASAQRYESIFAAANTLTGKESALLGLSGVRQNQRQWAQALAVYERLIDLKPQSERAQLGMAYLALKLDPRTIAQAETVLDRWQANYPTTPAAMVSLELLNLVGELPPSAERLTLYETLLAIAPTHLPLNRRYAQTLALTDPDAAIAYLEQLTPTNPEDLDRYFVQGEVAQTLGQLDLASQAYEAILVQRPDDVDALAALGGVRFQQRRYAEAEVLYEEILIMRPGDRDTRRILAELSLAQDDPTGAFQQFETLASEAPDLQTTPPLEHRIQDIRLNFLRRRGFQPYWEQY